METFPRYWPFVRGIHRPPVNSPHKGQWRGVLMFSLICAWINGWVNNGEAGDLRRYGAHYNVTVMSRISIKPLRSVYLSKPTRLIATGIQHFKMLFATIVWFKINIVITKKYPLLPAFRYKPVCRWCWFAWGRGRRGVAWGVWWNGAAPDPSTFHTPGEGGDWKGNCLVQTTHYSLMTPCDVMGLFQHWFRQWLPEPMLIYHHYNAVAFIWGHFHRYKSLNETFKSQPHLLGDCEITNWLIRTMKSPHNTFDMVMMG